jgi:serine/threonine protein kinase
MLQVHDRLGDFEIVRLLGKGGMGEVYEARQFNPDRPVALKVLAPWLAADEEALQRFMREAQVPAVLDHPGIVRIISTGKTPAGVAYYTMHLVRGISLSEMLRRTHRLPMPATVTHDSASDTPSAATPVEPDSGTPVTVSMRAESTVPLLQAYLHDRYRTVARIGAQAARALAHAHQRGYLHRDIKPSNLMVDQHDHVYLVDFGLTRVLDPTCSNTHAGIVPGTTWYMSPEQASGSNLDGRSDVYSLGVTLFELATQGRGPFAADRHDKQAVLTQVRAGQTLPLRTLAPDIPVALEQIIRRAMHPHVPQRYGDAAELARDLEAVAAGNGDHRPQPDTSRRARRQLWRAGLATTALVLAVLAVALLLPRRQGQENNAAQAEGLLGVPPAGVARESQEAVPELLRQPALHTAMPLLQNNFEPLWAERWFGSGKYRPGPQQLELYAPPSEVCTILGLADPGRPCFEFTIELNQVQSFTEGYTNELGIVFGWQRQRANAKVHPRVFVLRLDEYPADDKATSRVTLGTAWLVENNELRAETGEWLKPLPANKGTIPLTMMCS